MPVPLRILLTPGHRLQEYSPEDDLAVIEYGKQQLLVETRLLGPFPHRLRSVYQLIGDMDELEVSGG